MDREALAALERDVGAMRIRVAEKGMLADSFRHRRPPERHAEIATAILAIVVLAVFVAGREVGMLFTRSDTCASIAITGVARVTLERRACFGDCPVYRVALDTNGNMTWDGISDVATKGHVEKKVPAAAVRALVTDMATSCFFEMNDSYRAAASDQPMSIITLGVRGRTKRVSSDQNDHVSSFGCNAPTALHAFDSRIDQIAGTALLIGAR